jgi:hypothetical protein
MPFTKKTVPHLNTYFTILCFCIAAFFAGCSKSNPASFVDGYSASLTEEKGTTYTGDYFPIREGYTCYYQGSANLRVKLSVPGEINIDSTINSPTSGMMSVLPLRSITLSSGAQSLYPIIDMTSITGQAMYDTSRFFMKNDSAVYIKAIKSANGSYTEVKNPIYIKSKLVVGDSWETTPELDITQLMQSQDLMPGTSISGLNLSVQAKFFVAGKEQVTVPIGTRQAIRMEQANEISLSGSMVSDSIHISMNVDAKLTVIYHLVKDTGIIKQNITGPINITASAQGMTVTMSLTFNQCDLGLTSLGTYAIASAGKCTIQRDNASSSNPSIEQKMIKISKAIQQGIITSLKF